MKNYKYELTNKILIAIVENKKVYIPTKKTKNLLKSFSTKVGYDTTQLGTYKFAPSHFIP